VGGRVKEWWVEELKSGLEFNSLLQQKLTINIGEIFRG
jgi:hypothetical protein